MTDYAKLITEARERVRFIRAHGGGQSDWVGAMDALADALEDNERLREVLEAAVKERRAWHRLMDGKDEPLLEQENRDYAWREASRGLDEVLGRLGYPMIRTALSGGGE
jgi:hypothetical protein